MSLVASAIELVIKWWLNAPEAWECQSHRGWDANCWKCNEDAAFLSKLQTLQEVLK